MDCVRIGDDEVVVQLTDYIKHDGYVHHLHELYRVLYEIRKEFTTKKLRFLSVETEPYRMVAFDTVLEHVATSLGLGKDKIILDCYEHHPRFESSWATVETRPSTSLTKFFDHIELEKCQRRDDARLFGGLFGRFTIHRFLMAYFLETEMAEHSVVAFHPTVEWAEYECNSVMKYLDKEFQWLRERHKSLESLDPGYNGRIDDFKSMYDYHNIFGTHHIEVIIETNVHDCGWFTEKTAKCLYSGKPFLLFGTAGQLAELRKMGFKTFSGWIDESYDLEPNTERRFDLIKDEIRRLSKKLLPMRSKMMEELNSIADFNKENYKSIIKGYVESYDNKHH